MKINASDAVSHIVNSLDNTNSNYWYDTDNEITWVVGGTGDTIYFRFRNEDDDEVSVQAFKLVEE